mmetsp:Transcript_27018/g.55923  ORF Transcript_27018/g.55923 Transcript_27018/m.55923 type:complete len:120 (-) Transcript_27018:904-1263(-)
MFALEKRVPGAVTTADSNHRSNSSSSSSSSRIAFLYRKKKPVGKQKIFLFDRNTNTFKQAVVTRTRHEAFIPFHWLCFRFVPFHGMSSRVRCVVFRYVEMQSKPRIASLKKIKSHSMVS